MNRQIIGPVVPLPTPFKSDESVDYSALSAYVKTLYDGGIRNVMTTIGTSRFNLCTHEEIQLINKCVAEAAPDDMKVIVANPTTGGIATTVALGKAAQQAGADYYLVFFPDRHYGIDNTYDYFKAVHDALEIKILIHEMPMRNGLGPGQVQYSLELLDRLLSLPRIVGFKEEALNKEYSLEILEKFGETTEFIGAGGGMSRYLTDVKYGVVSFLSGIANFHPETELNFFELMQAGKVEEATSIVNDIEQPFFQKVVPFGWHPSLKAALALKGLLPAYERRPMKQMATHEVAAIKSALESQNWL